jgi:hypothetical protein
MAGGAGVVARPRQEQRIAQGGFVLAPAHLACARRCGGKRQPMAPGAGPFCLVPHHVIERGEPAPTGKRGVRKALSGTAWRSQAGTGTAKAALGDVPGSVHW